MGLKIICSGYLVRYPLGGKSWHELQYLLGMKRLGHDVTYVEHFGWPDSCYNPASNVMTGNPRYGISFLRDLLQDYGLDNHWCYIAEDNTTYGARQKQLEVLARECDLYINQSNVNWIPELEGCARRVLVDTDPVFTQIGAHGLGGLHTRYHVLFTYGHNVHQPFSSMPTGGLRWLPTRPPIVLDQWSVETATASAPFSTVMNWSPIGDQVFEGQVYGMKEREFEPFYSLPSESKQMMEIAVNVSETVRDRLTAGGWQIADPVYVTRSPFSYQIYLKSSRAEFSVAKHGYVAASCGWFSERSASYLASGRPVVIQDTGFSHWLPTGSGIMAFKTHADALAGIENVNSRYDKQCRAAREIAEEYFDSNKVLTYLIERSMNAVADASALPKMESL
jgi:hypothetical protein